MNKRKLREDFYKKRAVQIKDDCEFDVQEEIEFQKRNHSFYESNNAEN